MKVAFIIGHTKLNKGAYSKHAEKYEYYFYKELKPYLRTLGDVFTHNPLIYGYNSRQKNTALKTKNYDLVFELHFNSFDGKKEGCEALYYHSNNKTRLMADSFCDYYTEQSGSSNRGAKPLKPNFIKQTRKLSKQQQRGLGFVYFQKPPAILLEPFFGDNAIDYARFSPSILQESLRKTISFAETIL